MTEKENFLRVMRGEEPAWVPRYGQMPDPYSTYKPAVVSVRCAPTSGTTYPDGSRVDIFGVEYTPTDSTGGMALPTPGKFILDDITKWRDVIKAPSLEGIDWETVAKEAVENIDRKETAVIQSTHVGYFQHLMNFMGFTEGLLAMAEEPEEVYALFEYLADFYEEAAKKFMYYLKPDVMEITDDTATARNPFISPKMYRELVKPFHVRLANIANDFGIPIDMHNCGRCEDFIDDWLEFGVRSWNPAQVMNDLVGIKRKYGNKLVLIGCWDSQGPAGWSGASEELVRAKVRRVIDTFAPGGGFMFWGSVYGPQADEEHKQRARWITDEYNKYGRTFYQRAH